jgi:hypothetical protein
VFIDYLELSMTDSKQIEIDKIWDINEIINKIGINSWKSSK